MDTITLSDLMVLSPRIRPVMVCPACTETSDGIGKFHPGCCDHKGADSIGSGLWRCWSCESDLVGNLVDGRVELDLI